MIEFVTQVDSYFLILLLLDMSKVTRMAQFALSSSHQLRISENLAHSMFVLAPTLVLNTLVTTLLMGTGLLTGFQRLELLSRYAIIYQVVNFLIYVTFYPAGLSLILELMYTTDGRPGNHQTKVVRTSFRNCVRDRPSINDVSQIWTFFDPFPLSCSMSYAIVKHCPTPYLPLLVLHHLCSYLLNF